MAAWLCENCARRSSHTSNGSEEPVATAIETRSFSIFHLSFLIEHWSYEVSPLPGRLLFTVDDSRYTITSNAPPIDQTNKAGEEGLAL
jgi:hypothetical protein